MKEKIKQILNNLNIYELQCIHHKYFEGFATDKTKEYIINKIINNFTIEELQDKLNFYIKGVLKNDK